MRELDRADSIVHAGDFVEASVLEQLRTLGPVHAVHGNVDTDELRALLPAEAVLPLGQLRIGVVHDAGPRQGRHGRLADRFPGCAAVIYGHSHEPEVAAVAGTWFLNPGSPTQRRRAPAHTMLRLLVAEQRLVPELVELP